MRLEARDPEGLDAREDVRLEARDPEGPDGGEIESDDCKSERRDGRGSDSEYGYQLEIHGPHHFHQILFLHRFLIVDIK